eukprot:scaffold12388_cov53-Phaeocystis_antarctica.AAC.2
MIRRAAGGVPSDPTAWPQRVSWWGAEHGLALARKCNELWRRALAGSGARGSAEWGSAFAQTGMLLNLERLQALPGDGQIRFDDDGVAHVDEEEEEEEGEEEVVAEEAAAAAGPHVLGARGAEADCGDAKEGSAGEFAVGRRVRIHGLKGRQDLNGRVGSVIAPPNERGRWGVAVAFRLANGRWQLQECVQVKWGRAFLCLNVCLSGVVGPVCIPGLPLSRSLLVFTHLHAQGVNGFPSRLRHGGAAGLCGAAGLPGRRRGRGVLQRLGGGGRGRRRLGRRRRRRRRRRSGRQLQLVRRPRRAVGPRPLFSASTAPRARRRRRRLHRAARVPPSASLPSHAAGEDKENARGRGDEERGLAAERQPHAEQRAAASPNSLATLGSDYPEDAAPEHEEHAAAPTDDAGAKRQRLSEEVAPAAS